MEGRNIIGTKKRRRPIVLVESVVQNCLVKQVIRGKIELKGQLKNHVNLYLLATRKEEDIRSLKRKQFVDVCGVLDWKWLWICCKTN
jgi:hypothetical protein